LTQRATVAFPKQWELEILRDLLDLKLLVSKRLVTKLLKSSNRFIVGTVFFLDTRPMSEPAKVSFSVIVTVCVIALVQCLIGGAD